MTTKQKLEELKNLIMRSYNDINYLIRDFEDTEARDYLINDASSHLQNALDKINAL